MHNAENEKTPRPQPGQSRRHLGSRQPVQERRRVGDARSRRGKSRSRKYEKFRGTLGDGPAALAKCLEFDSDFDRAGERLGTYAYLKTAEDMADSRYQRMLGRYEHAATLAAEAASFIRPEILVAARRRSSRSMSTPSRCSRFGCSSSG